jgi:hypothetical protein
MNISTLEAFVDQENRWSAVFGKPALSLLNPADRQVIADRIDAALSPENLSCDGELSRTEVDRKFKRLTRAAEQLLSIDPSVTMWEYSGYC